MKSGVEMVFRPAMARLPSRGVKVEAEVGLMRLKLSISSCGRDGASDSMSTRDVDKRYRKGEAAGEQDRETPMLVGENESSGVDA